MNRIRPHYPYIQRPVSMLRQPIPYHPSQGTHTMQPMQSTPPTTDEVTKGGKRNKKRPGPAANGPKAGISGQVPVPVGHIPPVHKNAVSPLYTNGK